MDQSELIQVLLEKRNMAYKVQLCIENCEDEADKKILVDGLKTLLTEIDELEGQLVEVKEQSPSDKVKELLLNYMEYTILQMDTGLLSKRTREIKERIIRRDASMNLPEDYDPNVPIDKTKAIEFLLNEMRILQGMESIDLVTLATYREDALKRLDEHLRKNKQ